MQQSTTILTNEQSVYEAQARRFCIPLFIATSLYPVWAKIHYMVDPNSIDSYVERFAIYGLMIVLILIARFTHLRSDWKLHLLQSNRWIFVGHYFSLAARNHVSVQYALPVFFLTFHTAAAFERPRTFFLFSAYAMALSFTCVSYSPFLPTFFFRAAIGSCLILSGVVMQHRFRLTQAMRANEKMLRDMFETAGVGMALLDLRGKIIAANGALARMLALPVGNIAGRRLEDFSLEPASSFQADLDRLVKREITAWNLEHCFRNGRSQVAWGKISASLITSTTSFILAIVEDISRQKETEQLVRDRQEKMHYSARMAALGEMAGGIAHEINNPLAIIDVTASVLGSKFSSGELDTGFTRDSLAKIQKMSDRIAKIIRGLRSFSRDGSHDPCLLHTVHELVQNAIDLCEQKVKSGRVALHVPEGPTSYVVKCRGVEVSQVLLNILNNAFDAVADQPDKWIRIAYQPEPDFVRIDISNSGPLISVENRQKIFQPFFTTKPIGQGVGLGLSISHGIMASQGGKLVLDTSRPYTCFSVWVPRGAGL